MGMGGGGLQEGTGEEGGQEEVKGWEIREYWRRGPCDNLSSLLCCLLTLFDEISTEFSLTHPQFVQLSRFDYIQHMFGNLLQKAAL